MDKNLARREYLLRGLRRICLGLPEAAETVKWNNPTFVAGKKMFAVLDRYHGRWCIAFRADPPRQDELVRMPGFFPAPYAAKHGWVCLDTDKGPVDWAGVERLVTDSYRSVALRRMLSAMTAPPPRPRV